LLRAYDRLPIKPAMSSRTSDVFRDAGMAEAVQSRGLDVLSGSLRRLFLLELAEIK
jgi:hypothetical protein